MITILFLFLFAYFLIMAVNAVFQIIGKSRKRKRQEKAIQEFEKHYPNSTKK